MSDFKVGDRVRVTNKTALKEVEGYIGTIIMLGNGYSFSVDFYPVTKDKNGNNLHDADKLTTDSGYFVEKHALEHYTENKKEFKIGDKVKITDKTMYTETIGHMGTIVVYDKYDNIGIDFSPTTMIEANGHFLHDFYGVIKTKTGLYIDEEALVHCGESTIPSINNKIEYINGTCSKCGRKTKTVDMIFSRTEFCPNCEG